MAIRFFFEYDKQIVQLPVNPEEVKITSSGNNKTEQIITLGDINILRDIKLSECKIKCFLPADSNAPYVLTKGKFEKPDFYINFFAKVRKDKQPCRFIISDTSINMLVGIEAFDWNMKAGTDDVEYNLSLKEYRPYSFKTLTLPSTQNSTTGAAISATVNTTSREKTGFAIGDVVTVTGRYWYTSYGNSPYGTFDNFTGKISHIVSDKSRKYRYHITTMNGGYRGWVAESQLKHTQ